ncbi:MerR family transcriptional regulator [Pseudodesulfovibrio sp. F-1]|uniref:MerR family transcriptional regulator n=2 Tax=Pseudodesulfovibrio alkaliphilus TaxID=2661613 RepID=A0A7K1KQW3_9BACT|nr:MerR family transcriptional regulator [Pseudodesulfovibrio alkaliphilus]
MSKPYVSLREVGRLLDVPPSTIVYYKDKFQRFIPSVGGEGRRRRYPAAVVEVFRRIREMFADNCSVDQIERELVLRFGDLLGDSCFDQCSDQYVDQRVGRSAVSGCGVHGSCRPEAGGVLDKIADALENQSLFRSEIRSLRDEVDTLRRERREVEREYSTKVSALEKEIAELRRRMASRASGGGIDFPPAEFLSGPLVICSEGEYLGVQGKGGRPFSLQDFVRLIERKMSESMDVEISWRRQDGHWVLVVRTEDRPRRREQNIVLVSRRTVTPSGNIVTEVTRLNIDGNDAPDALLLTLFRQLRAVFNG